LSWVVLALASSIDQGSWMFRSTEPISPNIFYTAIWRWKCYISWEIKIYFIFI